MPDTSPRPDLYISADVETDGPIPGPFSMLSFGFSVVGSFAGDQLHRFPNDQSTVFYVELKPISDEFQEEALTVNGLDRGALIEQGSDPRDAMNAAAEWIRAVSENHRPVLVAYPVAFDWSFLYWYFERFADHGSPFGFSSCLDIRTLYQAAAGTVHDQSGKASMPPSLLPDSPHTHNALDDAIEQGELFANVFTWATGKLVDRHRESWAPSWIASHLSPDPA